MNGYASRKELLEHINSVSFAVNDLTLFLDTHPCNKEALSSFYKYREERTKALKEYASCYGPLTIDTVNPSACDNWNWINEPWPWQEGGC
nr:spore coat protein CotJB [uncultured Sellimonas sp.]